MAFEIIKASFSKAKAKATIHLTGRLGFNIEASNLMALKSGQAFHLAKDTDNANKFYLLVAKEEDGAGKIAKAGAYFYLNIGDAFEKANLNFKTETIIFDVSKDIYDGETIFVMDKRKSLPRKLDKDKGGKNQE